MRIFSKYTLKSSFLKKKKYVNFPTKIITVFAIQKSSWKYCYEKMRYDHNLEICTAWKVLILGVFPVHILPHSNWLRTRKTPNNDSFDALIDSKNIHVTDKQASCKFSNCFRTFYSKHNFMVFVVFFNDIYAFRLYLHSVNDWISRNSLLEAGAIFKV